MGINKGERGRRDSIIIPPPSPAFPAPRPFSVANSDPPLSASLSLFYCAFCAFVKKEKK